MLSSKRQQIDVVGCRVDVCSLSTATAAVLTLAQTQQYGYVCLANVHMCMTAKDNADFAAILDQASYVFADGRPIFWAQRLLGAEAAEQIRGVDLMLAICQQAQTNGLRLGLYGGKDELLLRLLEQRLTSLFPKLQIVYAWSPPFRPLSAEEDFAQCARIVESGVDLLFVGLGCPKQEQWMAAHQQLATVKIGVGAAFDFIAGVKQQAPRAVQRLGMEWLHRLISEPSRLIGRYLRHNPRFLSLFTAQWLGRAVNKQLNKIK